MSQILSTEQSFFLSVLSDYISDRTSVSKSDVDTKAIAQLSNYQQLSPILFYQTKIPTLQSALASASYYAINRGKLLEKIDALFHGHNISYLIFKGAEVAQYYQHPYLRTSGDMDILVRGGDKEKAAEILERMGFKGNGKNNSDHEWCFHKSDFEIELHHRLLYDVSMNKSTQIAFTDTAWEHATTEDGIRYHLEPEFHFVFLLLHLRKHFLWAGIGVRQFMDLAAMARNADLNWGRIEEYINICGIQQFSSTCFALINRWFGVSVPLSSASITDEFYYQATNTVLSGSVFGDMSEDNLEGNRILNYTRKHGKLRSTFAILFPPYEQMKEKYPKIGRCKLSLPLMWIVRIIESLLHHSAQDGLSYAAKHLTPNTQRTEELKSWGLM